jgi:hypothetical protein
MVEKVGLVTRMMHFAPYNSVKRDGVLGFSGLLAWG